MAVEEAIYTVQMSATCGVDDGQRSLHSDRIGARFVLNRRSYPIIAATREKL